MPNKDGSGPKGQGPRDGKGIPQFMILTVALFVVGLFGLQSVGVGQITLTDLFDNYAVAVSVLAVGFGLCAWSLRKLWGASEQVVAFERRLNSSTSLGNAGKSGRSKEILHEQ